MDNREIDALVAEKVMGWKRNPGSSIWYRADDPNQYAVMKGKVEFEPSTDIAAAWQVVEKMGRWNGFDFVLSMPDRQYYSGKKWSAGWFEMTHEGYESRASAEAETVPLAICLAALKAIGHKVKEEVR